MKQSKTNKNPGHSIAPVQQRGVALIIGLTLLVTLTVIGIGALTTTSLEHRMAGNMGELNLAFNAAENSGRAIVTAIRNSNLIARGELETATTCTTTTCATKGLDKDWWEAADEAYWSTNAQTYTGTGSDSLSKSQFIIEQDRTYDRDSDVMGYEYSKQGVLHYRITSRGEGSSNNSEVVIQQVILKRP